MSEWKRDTENFKDGAGLKPLQSLRLDRVSSFRDMLNAMENTAFTGRQLGRACRILKDAFTDPCTQVVLTLSGALTVAKQGDIICDMIERGYVDMVISTGALLTHGLIEGMGVRHFQTGDIDDGSAFKMGYNRIYDTYELEVSFQELQDYIETHLEELVPAITGKSVPQGSADFCRRFGELMIRDFPHDRNILTAAAKRNIPVYIPAFTDCELSIDLSIQYMKKTIGLTAAPFKEAHILPFNPFQDLYDYSRRVHEHDGKLAIFTLGGGVPRNWAQQVAPLIDIMRQEGFDMNLRIFSSGVRICPEPVHWGGLSGCTYQEGVSWGKFLPESEGGRYAEIPAEVTAVLPLLMKAVFEWIDEETGEKSKK